MAHETIKVASLRWIRTVAVWIAILLTVRAEATVAQVGTRAVAITIDDLPAVGGVTTAGALDTVTTGIVEALERHAVRATGFVISKLVFVEGQTDRRLNHLRRWVTAGVDLGNHTFTHDALSRTPPDVYARDVLKGDAVPRMVMDEADRPMRYFRFPYNDLGEDTDTRTAMTEVMEMLQYLVAPFTVEHADYMFNRLYDAALAAGDRAATIRIENAYIAHLDTAFAFAEMLADDTFGRPIPHVFLIHANRLNAMTLDRMLDGLRRRGYRFITLGEAMEDSAYATEDGYVGRFGFSWLHRWRRTLGQPNRLRDEPDPPAWVMEAYRELQSANDSPDEEDG